MNGKQNEEETGERIREGSFLIRDGQTIHVIHSFKIQTREGGEKNQGETTVEFDRQGDVRGPSTPHFTFQQDRRLRFEFKAEMEGTDLVESSLAQRRKREQQIKNSIASRLEESGERERLEEWLRTKLIEHGWRDELKAYCKGALFVEKGSK